MPGRKRYFMLVVAAVFCAWPVFGDIYTYIDSNGVRIFTNTPTSSDYKLYIREQPEKIEPEYDSEQFDEIIQMAQEKFGIEFSLIKAVIKVESGFNPNAVSKVGAKGLMQIMPLNFKTLYIEDPFDPQDNIMGGTRYLLRLMQRYEYKLPLVLAAYNAGPEAVDKYKQIPPYRETENYVRKVMKTYSQYKKS